MIILKNYFSDFLKKFNKLNKNCINLVIILIILGLGSNLPVIAADNISLAHESTSNRLRLVRPFIVKTEKKVSVTAYTSEVAQTDSTPFITANGSRVKDGIVAANWLPFGTKIQIPSHFGDKVFTVEDRMNTKHNQKVDIWMDDINDAKTWGSRRVVINVLAPNPEYLGQIYPEQIAKK